MCTLYLTIVLLYLNDIMLITPYFSFSLWRTGTKDELHVHCSAVDNAIAASRCLLRLVCCRFLPPLDDSHSPTFIKEKPDATPLQIDNINNTRSSANAEIARVGGCYAVQGHSMLLTLVPIRSPYATSQWIILTYVVSRTVMPLVKSSPLIRGCLSLTYSSR